MFLKRLRFWPRTLTPIGKRFFRVTILLATLAATIAFFQEESALRLLAIVVTVETLIFALLLLGILHLAEYKGWTLEQQDKSDKE